MQKKKYSTIISVALLLVILVVAYLLINSQSTATTYQYDEIINYFEKDDVEKFELDLGSSKLSMIVKDDTADKGTKKITYVVPYIQRFLDDIDGYVEAHNAKIDNLGDRLRYNYLPATETPAWMGWLQIGVFTAIIIGLWIFMMKRTTDTISGGGKAASFGKAKVVRGGDKNKKTFADVAGADEEKEELEEIVEFLKNPKKYKEIGAKIPRGVLLEGPPGTGKTLLAKAVAGEANVPFFSISGSDFVEMYVGVGASRVRDLFHQAKSNAPSIVFIDEIDAVGRHRGAGLGGGHDEREQTLNQLLVEMDGFGENSGVIVIAATNRKDILDPALLRPGRFDRHITVGYPDVKGREEILRVHAKNKPMGPDVDLKIIAQSSVGFTGADLENLLNEAALLAAKRGLLAITMSEIEEATIKVMMGPEKRSRKITPEDTRLAAYHEAGHAVSRYYMPLLDTVHEISIIPRGSAGGYTMWLPEKDETCMGRKWMQQSIVSALGGRVAEAIIFDDITTGASSDIKASTDYATQMVTKFGFSDLLGPIVYGGDGGEIFLGREYSNQRHYSEALTSKIDSEIRRIIDEAYNTCESVLTEHKDKLEEVAQFLIKHEKMNGEVFKALMEGTYVEPAEAEAAEPEVKPETENSDDEKTE